MPDENSLGGSVGLDITDFRKGVSELKNQIKNIETGFRASAVTMEDWGNTSNGLRERVNSLREEISKQKQEMEIYRQELTKVSSGSEADQKAADSLTNKMYSLQKQIGYNEKDFQKYNTQLTEVEKSEKKNSSATGRLGQSFMNMAERSRQSTSRIKEHFGNLKSAVAGYITGIISTMSLKEVIEDTDAAEKNLSQMTAVLKSTGDASGMTKEKLVELAEAQSKLTTYSAETTEKAENMLLTFTNIKSSVFPQTVQATEDMATAMHMDATQAALQLGKALNDPATGYSKLQRVGVTFTASQVKTIKAMEKAGNTAGAQKIILQELEKEYGNSAKAAGSTLTGQIQRMENNIKSSGVQIMGALLPIIQNLMPSIVKGVQDLSNKIQAHKAQIVAAFTAVGNSVKTVFSWVESHGKLVKGAIVGIVSTMAAWKTAMLVANTVITVHNGLVTAGIIKSGEAAAATATQTAANVTATGAQEALNVAESANPIGAIVIGIVAAAVAIAGLVAGIKALVKHFQSSSIETKKFGRSISASTQKSLNSFNDLNQKADKNLKELAWSGETVTKKMADTIKKNIDDMAKQTIAGFRKQRDESIKAIQGLAEKGSGITQKQMQQMVADVNAGYTHRISSEKQEQAKINSILQNAASKHRGLTKQESDQISAIKSQMYNNGVKALSKNQVEEQAIYDNMRVNHTATSTQEAASIVKDSKTTTDKVISDANKKYKGVVGDIIRERDETHSISADQANKLIKAAKKQRDDSVAAAKDQHKKVVAEAKKQAGDLAGQVDWTTGKIKSKWQVMKDDVVSKSKKMWADVKSEFGKAKSDLANKAENIGKAIIHGFDGTVTFIKKLPSEALQWGKDFIQGFVNGIKNTISKVTDAVKSVAQEIHSFLHFSKPDKGPLADADQYGKDFMQLLADTMDANSSKPAESAKKVAQLVSDRIVSIKTDTEAAVKGINAQLSKLGVARQERSGQKLKMNTSRKRPRWKKKSPPVKRKPIGKSRKSSALEVPQKRKSRMNSVPGNSLPATSIALKSRS